MFLHLGEWIFTLPDQRLSITVFPLQRNTFILAHMDSRYGNPWDTSIYLPLTPHQKKHDAAYTCACVPMHKGSIFHLLESVLSMKWNDLDLPPNMPNLPSAHFGKGLTSFYSGYLIRVLCHIDDQRSCLDTIVDYIQNHIPCESHSNEISEKAPDTIMFPLSWHKPLESLVEFFHPSSKKKQKQKET